MDLMNSIASASMSMSAAQLSQQYAVSVTKKAMDTQEQTALRLLDMLPQVPKGQYVDIMV